MKINGKVIPEKYIKCRTMGHSWKPHDAWKERRFHHEHRVCPDCGGNRFLLYNSNGVVVKSKYDMPPDYPVEGGLTTDDKGRLKLTVVKRMERKHVY